MHLFAVLRGGSSRGGTVVGRFQAAAGRAGRLVLAVRAGPEYGETAGKVADAARAEQRQRFAGYRVCIFSDNGPEAREGAFEAKKLFEETFPDVKVYMGYENPYFKVSVGNCLTAEEAIILKGRVSATFPKAFLKNEEIAVSDLVEP